MEFLHLNDDVLDVIISFCDEITRYNLKQTCRSLASIIVTPHLIKAYTLHRDYYLRRKQCKVLREFPSKFEVEQYHDWTFTKHVPIDFSRGRKGRKETVSCQTYHYGKLVSMLELPNKKFRNVNEKFILFPDEEENFFLCDRFTGTRLRKVQLTYPEFIDDNNILIEIEGVTFTSYFTNEDIFVSNTLRGDTHSYHTNISSGVRTIQAAERYQDNLYTAGCYDESLQHIDLRTNIVTKFDCLVNKDDWEDHYGYETLFCDDRYLLLSSRCNITECIDLRMRKHLRTIANSNDILAYNSGSYYRNYKAEDKRDTLQIEYPALVICDLLTDEVRNKIEIPFEGFCVSDLSLNSPYFIVSLHYGFDGRGYLMKLA